MSYGAGAGLWAAVLAASMLLGGGDAPAGNGDSDEILRRLLKRGQESGSSPSDLKQRREEAQKLEAKLLDELRPTGLLASFAGEKALARAIDFYQQVAAQGGWPRVPTGKSVRLGDMSEIVSAVRARLEVTEGLPRIKGNGWVFDDNLEIAVKRFQKRHGIPPSGIVERRTIGAMNVPAEARLAQMRVNVVRMQELLGEGLPPRYVLVNVPAYELQAVESGEIALWSRVIVGRPERPTPTVTAKIKGLNFFPFWHVPESVVFGDLVPKLATDPGYLEREHIRVLTDWQNGTEVDWRQVDWSSPQAQTLRFKQDPGPQNALGLVRIDMPNEHTVYMHDTPLKNLFGRSGRAYSAGCIRVQRVFDLVAWLAGANGDWDRARVDGVLSAGQALDVELLAPVEVHFVYITAWASPEGVIQFREDIYERDGAAEVAMRDDREAPPADVYSLAP